MKNNEIERKNKAKNEILTHSTACMRELQRFAQHAIQLRRFSGKTDLPLGSSSPLNKI